ncbi:MAG: serine hydrolase, partial [Caulobacteraceae bacterium]
MTVSRRRALALSACGALAACGRPRPPAPTFAGPLKTDLLDHEFPALADLAQPGAFALGIMDLSTTAAWYWNTDRAFPLATAAALPIAVAALAQVDARRLSLGQQVRFGALDLSPPPSLINRVWPNPPDRHVASIPT